MVTLFYVYRYGRLSLHYCLCFEVTFYFSLYILCNYLLIFFLSLRAPKGRGNLYRSIRLGLLRFARNDRGEDAPRKDKEETILAMTKTPMVRKIAPYALKNYD